MSEESESDENKPKAKTIESLKTFEQGKAAANASLSQKLANFMEALTPEERSDFEPLLRETPRAVENDSTPVVSVFLKPMQVSVTGQTKDVDVFLKPMQIRADDGGSDVEIYLKPMQVKEGEVPRDVTVFLKPMQVAGTEITIKMTPGGSKEVKE